MFKTCTVVGRKNKCVLESLNYSEFKAITSIRNT